MFFERINPSAGLQHIIECYWVVKDENPTPNVQKIIPDGFTELIFHLGDPYKIKLDKQWKSSQAYCLQVRSADIFYYRTPEDQRFLVLNSNLRPLLISMVLICTPSPTKSSMGPPFSQKKSLCCNVNFVHQRVYSDWISKAEDHFKWHLSSTPLKNTHADKAVDLIFEKKGMITVAELSAATAIGERQLENHFRKFVGLSPKFFSRIIRFNYIFDLVRENKQQWTALAYEAAY
jgi:AraC-like DNA-binding protein